MNSNRPVNLDLTTIKFPITAIASIIHRISGLGIFILLPVMLWALQQSLASEASFNDLKSILSGDISKFITWVVLSALAYHLFAGIKHLLMDLGIGETLEGGTRGAIIVLITAALAIAGLGVWLW